MEQLGALRTELAQCQVGILALAAMPLPTERRGQGQADVPVLIQGTWVRPGDWLVADADLPEAILAVGRAGRVRDTVFIGGSKTPPTAGAHLSRPIDALHSHQAREVVRRAQAMAY